MDQLVVINHTLEAYNISASSENKIHDDTIAKQFGFEGGLVPGVEVYAYMTNPIIQHFGYQWLESGHAECKFVKPVYNGEQTLAKATVLNSKEISLEVTTTNSFCAKGAARIDNNKNLTLDPDHSLFPLPEFESRPNASPKSLKKGKMLGTFQQLMTVEDQDKYLQDIREPLGIYQKEKIVHPGWLLRMANKALSMNVKLGPWIHVGSKIQNFAIAHYGETLFTHTCVSNSYEHKGHLFVELNIMILNNEKCLTHINHTAIYQPRQAKQEN